jgi:hypothetical protein
MPDTVLMATLASMATSRKVARCFILSRDSFKKE